MGLTQAQLLASLGAREITGDQCGVFRAVEDPATRVRIMGEVVKTRQDRAVSARIAYHDTRLYRPYTVCQLTAELRDGRYVVTVFTIGAGQPLRDGQWYGFDEGSACAFVRAVMLELEAKRLPDLDALLTYRAAGGMLRSIPWDG